MTETSLWLTASIFGAFFGGAVVVTLLGAAGGTSLDITNLIAAFICIVAAVAVSLFVLRAGDAS
ncbi:MAG: hypothetical protein PVSMB7_30070 [Chloroflexota bacterium]